MRGLKGFSGQTMSGSKPDPVLGTLQAPVWTTAGATGTYTATEDCYAFIFLNGGGGAGGTGGTNGGGGGAAVYKKVRLTRGQQIAYVAGAAVTAGAGFVSGSDSTATLPDGAVLTARGATSSDGGVGSGGDLNRTGGAGGVGTAAGSAGTNGAAGASGGSALGAGGGAAGFNDFFLLPLGAAGSGGSAAGYPGSGAGGDVTTSSAGRVVIAIMPILNLP